MSINPKRLTQAHVRTVHCDLLAALRRNGIRLQTGSALQTVLEDLEWLAAHSADPSDYRGAWLDNPNRASNAALAIFGAERLLRALGSGAPRPGVEVYENKLRGLACIPSGREDSNAADLFFEMEVAQRISPMFGAVSFAEPDVVVTDSYGGRLLIACKRPVTLESTARALGRGYDKIKEVGGSGCIAVSLDRVCGGSVGPAPSTPWQNADDFERVCTEYARHCFQRVGRVVHESIPWNDEDTDSDAPRIILGAFLHVRHVGACAHPPSILWAEHTDVVANPRFPAAEVVLRGYFGVAHHSDS